MGHGDTDKKEDLVLKVLDPGILPVSLCTVSIRMDAGQCHCKGALKDLTSHVKECWQCYYWSGRETERVKKLIPNLRNSNFTLSSSA